MCVSHHDKPYRCCCCLPLICGVILIAALEVMNLVAACQTLDVFNIVLSSLMICMFVFSFVKHNSPRIRRHLFHSYLVSLILFVAYMTYWFITQPLDPFVSRVCDGVNKVANWSECASDVENVIWVFVMIYCVLVVLIKAIFIRILYYYYKEVADDHHHNQSYNSLSGNNKGNTSVNDDHTNAMH